MFLTTKIWPNDISPVDNQHDAVKLAAVLVGTMPIPGLSSTKYN